MAALGAFVGAVAALALDPPLFIVAIIVSAYSVTVKRFLLLFAVAGPATHLAISAVV